MVSYPIESMVDCPMVVLIDESAWKWNEELIDGIFSQEEVAIIKKIPLSCRVAEDVLIWPHTQDGQYTCKMGYRFLKEEVELGYMQEALGMDTNLWKGIWSLQIPNKVKKICYGGHDKVRCQQKRP